MRSKEEIAKAALIISERVMDEYPTEAWDELIDSYRSYENDIQLFTETLCHLLQENPEECEQLIGTIFCEEDEL